MKYLLPILILFSIPSLAQQTKVVPISADDTKEVSDLHQKLEDARKAYSDEQDKMAAKYKITDLVQANAAYGLSFSDDYKYILIFPQEDQSNYQSQVPQDKAFNSLNPFDPDACGTSYHPDAILDGQNVRSICAPNKKVVLQHNDVIPNKNVFKEVKLNPIALDSIQ